MHPHKPRFSMTLYKIEEFIMRERKKLNAVANHPLLGGAKLKTLTLKRLGVGFFNEKEVQTEVVNVASGDKNYRTYKSAPIAIGARDD